jgi:hypothetical protein
MAGKFSFLIVTAFLLAGCVSVHETRHIRESDTKDTTMTSKSAEPARVLHHVVLFKFKEDTSAEKIRELESAFRNLPDKIDAIYDFEWGTDVSVENLQQGYTHCFIITFLSEADRDAYLPHPAHKELGTMLSPYLDSVLVVDFWSK